MSAVVRPLHLLLLAHALLIQHVQATVEDISYLDYDLYEEGNGLPSPNNQPRVCLSGMTPAVRNGQGPILYASRSNISFSSIGGPASIPVQIWQFSWPLAHTLSEVVKIFLQEIMGFHAITYGNVGASNTAFTALLDCYNPGNVGMPCRPQAPGSRGHLAYEVWSNYDTSMLAKIATENLVDRTPIRVGYPGGIGYDGVEGIFVGSASYDAAAVSNLFLRWYQSYNNSWSSPQAYFTDYTTLSAPSQACETIGAWTMTGGLQNYITATGDNIPTVTVGNLQVTQCINGPAGNAGSWMPCKACRDRSYTGCLPIITTGGYSVPDMMQWSFWHNMATIIGSYAWGDYTSTVRNNEVLCYWWLPDDTFNGLGLVPIQFPTTDSDAIAQGIVATAKSATKIWKMMSSVLPGADPLLDTFMNSFEISMGSMMDMAVTYNSADPWQTACDFLRTYPQRWATWEPDRTACIAGQGLTTDSAGTQYCAWCSDGFYSMPHPTISTSRICEPCALGTFQGSPGQTQCNSCAPGHLASTTGQSACDACALGTFSNTTGRSECMSCGIGKDTPAFWTTMRNLQTPSGTKVSYINAATLASDCTCDAGTRYSGTTFSGDQCVACSPELACEGMGNVAVLAGYAAYGDVTSPDVTRIFECHIDQRWCPGGTPGVCQEGRQGIQCGECLPDHTPGSEGKCVPCEGSDTAPFIIVVLLVFLLLCIGYHVQAIKKDGQGKASMSVILVATTGSQLIVLVQMTGVFSSLSVEWAEPFGTLLAITKILTSFNLDILRLSCITSLSPLATYISRVSIIAIGFAAIISIFIVHTIVLMKGDFKKMGKKLIVSLGALSMALFISVVSTITAPFQCFKHPGDDWTVRTFPVVLCAEGEWVSMLVIAGVTTLFPVALLALVCWVVYNFPARMNRVDVDFFAVTGFLFVAYRTETYWFCLAIWFRNLTVSLVPIVPSIIAQISAFNALVICMIILVNKFSPWRAYIANYLDTAIYCMVLGVNGFAIGFADPDPSILAPMCLALFVAALCALVFVAIYGIVKVLAPAKKKYEFFVSHHKAAAGAFARLLKMMILEAKQNKCQVFIDADDLTSLDLLFDTVGTEVENISMVSTAEFMKRPWCIGELTIANVRKVKVYPVYLADFKPPDNDFIENYLKYVPDIKTLAENNITLESLQDAMRWFNTLNHITVPAKLSNITFSDLLSNILTFKMVDMTVVDVDDTVGNDMQNEGAKSKQSLTSSKSSATIKVRQDAQVMMVADAGNFEAMNTARILCKLLMSHMRSNGMDSNMLPEIMADCFEEGEEIELTKSTTMLVCVLTNGSITTPYILKCFKQASLVDASLVPVVADDGFRFPSAAFYQELRAAAVQNLGDEGETIADTIVNGVVSMFKRIAPLFESNAGISLLNAQSFEVFKKVKAVKDMPAESKTSDWASRGAQEEESKAPATTEVPPKVEPVGEPEPEQNVGEITESV